MARTGRGKKGHGSHRGEDEEDAVEISDTTVGTEPEDNPNEEYVEKLGILSQLWLDNVRNNQVEAYRELLDQLFILAREIYPLLSEADAEAVLSCIEDKSGQYLVGEKEFVLQVTKDDAVIRHKSWKGIGKTADRQEIKKALDEFYQEADTLAQTQSGMMDAIEELGEAIADHDTIVNILKHLQNPCIQVTATQEHADAVPRFPRCEEAAGKFDQYVASVEDLAMRHSAYMERLWQLAQVSTTHTAVLDVMNNVFIPPIQVTMTSRAQAEAAGGKPLQEMAISCHTPDPQTLSPKCSESTRVLAALVSFALQSRISGQQATAAKCAMNFQCDVTLMGVREECGKRWKRN